MIIAGHGRYAAAKAEGLPTAKVLVVDGWSEEDIRAYTIADNAIAARAGWDERLLKLELGDLEEMGFDLDLTGLGKLDLGRLLGEAVDHQNEWQGMPEFNQEDKRAFRSIVVHMPDQAAVEAFTKLIGQKITDRTRFLWYPRIEIETYADKRYTTAALPDES